VDGRGRGDRIPPLWRTRQTGAVDLLRQEEGETGRDETRVEVEVEPGTTPGKEKAVLRIEHDEGHKDVALTPLLCGASSECNNQPEGEVYRYQASVPGKHLALDIAGGLRLSVDAPGAKIAAPADPVAFILGRLLELVSPSALPIREQNVYILPASPEGDVTCALSPFQP
jgi:hypothetical protein